MGRSDTPAKRDLLDRARYVTALAALIRNEKTQAPLTIGIYGPWGSGKSSFLAQLTGLLENRHDVISFNPWRLSGGGEVWAGLVKAIAPFVDRNLGTWQSIRFIFVPSTTREVGKLHARLTAASKKVSNWLTGATAAGGILAASHLREVELPPSAMKRLGDFGLAEPLGAVLGWLAPFGLGDVKWGGVMAAAVVALVVGYVSYKAIRIWLRPFSSQFAANQAQFKEDSRALKDATYKDFEQLRTIIGDLTERRAKAGRPHLVLLIDDLDRCPPDRVIGVLEAVNLFISELPIVTVFAIDTRFVSSAVAARHRFLFGPQDGQVEKDRYGRLFLEKIIHIPFQLPAVRSYERYIGELMTVSEAPGATDDKGGEPVDPPTIVELMNGRYLRLLPALYVRFMIWAVYRTDSKEARWIAGIMARLMFGVAVSDEERRWLADQDPLTQALFARMEMEFQQSSDLFATVLGVSSLFERERQNLMATEISIEESDKTLLKGHMPYLRGNPRSIKRFVNTYQLAKGIRAQCDPAEAEGIEPASLATWLVMLQSWPTAGSTLCDRAKVEAVNPAPFFSDDWAQRFADVQLPAELVNFVNGHKVALEVLASSPRGLDIARCFSFFSAEA